MGKRNTLKRGLAIATTLLMAMFCLASCGEPGKDGKDGKSAYELACEKGYTGTEDEWIQTLAGKNGQNGKSAYELACEKGYTGTESEWLESLDGTDGKNGKDGKSAYELACDNGFSGTLTEWLASLVGRDGAFAGKGDKGDAGISITKVEMNEAGHLIVTFSEGNPVDVGYIKGQDGEDGTPGENGETGRGISKVEKTKTEGLIDTYTITYSDTTVSDFLVRNGADGATGATGVGITAVQIDPEGNLILTMSTGSPINVGKVKGEKGDKGETGTAGKDGSNGISVTGVALNEGHLIVTLSEGSPIDVGNVKGDKGDKGDEGLGIKSVAVNGSGHLIVTYTDDTFTDAGLVIGEKGEKGDKGADGAPGIGVKNAYINASNHIVFVLTDDSEIDAGLIGTTPVPLDYTVIFKDWDGTILKVATHVATGSAAEAPANPTRAGYEFYGWDCAFNHVTSDLTVTATYIEDRVYDDPFQINPDIDVANDKLTLTFKLTQSAVDPVPIAGLQLKVRYSENFKVNNCTPGANISAGRHDSEHYISVAYFNMGGIVSETFDYLTVEFDISDCVAGDRIYVDTETIANQLGQDITSKVTVDSEYIFE